MYKCNSNKQTECKYLNSYHIAGMLDGVKVWRITSSKVVGEKVW